MWKHILPDWGLFEDRQRISIFLRMSLSPAHGTWKLFMECLSNWAKEFQGLIHIHYIFGFSIFFYLGHVGNRSSSFKWKEGLLKGYKGLSLTPKVRN